MKLLNAPQQLLNTIIHKMAPKQFLKEKKLRIGEFEKAKPQLHGISLRLFSNERSKNKSLKNT